MAQASNYKLVGYLKKVKRKKIHHYIKTDLNLFHSKNVFNDKRRYASSMVEKHNCGHHTIKCSICFISIKVKKLHMKLIPGRQSPGPF